MVKKNKIEKIKMNVAPSIHGYHSNSNFHLIHELSSVIFHLVIILKIFHKQVILCIRSA